mgnify:CR=1 FL=1
MAEPQPTLGGTTQEHGTTRVSMSVQQDYVTVVGASHSTLMEDIRGQMGNKLRFINQGIRQLRKYPEGTTTDGQQQGENPQVLLERMPRMPP